MSSFHICVPYGLPALSPTLHAGIDDAQQVVRQEDNLDRHGRIIQIYVSM
jgi:hypothetical protein